MDQRFEMLETRVAFQEETIQKLDDALISQQKQILDLQMLLKHVSNQLETMENSFPDSPEAPPPHY